MKGFKAVLGIVCKRSADFIDAVQQIIAQLKNELVEVEHDINAVEGAVVVEEKPVSLSPVSVLVHWSESSVFKDEEVVYTFAEFERLAKYAAAANGNFKDNGYSKTKVTVCLVVPDYVYESDKVGNSFIDMPKSFLDKARAAKKCIVIEYNHACGETETVVSYNDADFNNAVDMFYASKV